MAMLRTNVVMDYVAYVSLRYLRHIRGELVVTSKKKNEELVEQ